MAQWHRIHEGSDASDKQHPITERMLQGDEISVLLSNDWETSLTKTAYFYSFSEVQYLIN